MAFTTKTRYGSMESFPDNADIPASVESLLRELETEQFEEPDNEHYQVAVGCGDWAITVTVSGLMILDDMRETPEGQPGPELFKRAASREEAANLLTLMARGDVETVRAAGWVPRDRLPPWKQDLFRK